MSVVNDALKTDFSVFDQIVDQSRVSSKASSSIQEGILSLHDSVSMKRVISWTNFVPSARASVLAGAKAGTCRVGRNDFRTEWSKLDFF